MKKRNSYNREYLQSAQEVLAAMIDVAVYYLGYKAADINKIINLYNPYHEMDIRQFCDKMDSLAEKKIDNYNRGY